MTAVGYKRSAGADTRKPLFVTAAFSAGLVERKSYGSRSKTQARSHFMAGLTGFFMQKSGKLWRNFAVQIYR